MQDCGECTLCCKLLHIKEVDSKPNEYCKHCDLNVGCNIYDNRPDGCREFQCAWLQMNQVGIEMRPDKCGVLFEKFTDSIMMGATDGYMAHLVNGQINSFNHEGISVVILDHSKKSKTYFLAKNHTKEFVDGEINYSS